MEITVYPHGMGAFGPPGSGIGGESGSILLASLVMLLLLTALGLQGMSSTSLEEKMANNSREISVAFQGAETALRAGEAWIESQTGVPTALTTIASCVQSGSSHTNNCVFGDGVIDYSTTYTNASNFANPTLWSTYATLDTQIQGSFPTSPPLYLIEHRSFTSVGSSGESLTVGMGSGKPTGSTVHYFRVTAQGVGNSGNADVIIQSNYAKAF